MAYFKRLRELREDHDLTQRDVAAILHIPQPQYWRYEQGYRDIPVDLLVQLADFYHVSVDYILERDASYYLKVKESNFQSLNVAEPVQKYDPS